MKFRFIWIGKTRNASWRSLQEDYLVRLRHFLKCEVTEIRDSSPPDPEIDSKRILDLLNPNAFVTVLDASGNQPSSQQIADLIEEWQSRGLKEVCFVIGGASGLSTAVGRRANHMLSLSFLTFTHEMARVILLEQLYRGYSMLKGFPYQK